MDGIEISARFALPPNSKEYCGTSSFAKKFAAYLKNKNEKNRSALESELRKFVAHYAYLKLIADANGKKPFDYEVAEALWIGNRLLDNVKKKDLQKLIRGKFTGRGKLSHARAKQLASKMPEGFLPHHTFHVLYLHTITGVIEPSVENADLCRPSWGKVISVNGATAALKSQKLVELNGRLALQEAKKKVELSCAGVGLLPGLKKGEMVASHWGVGVMGISQQQAKRLEKYTKQNIRALNQE